MFYQSVSSILNRWRWEGDQEDSYFRGNALHLPVAQCSWLSSGTREYYLQHCTMWSIQLLSASDIVRTMSMYLEQEHILAKWALVTTAGEAASRYEG